MSAMPAYLITLVHGTFARGAGWTLPGSEFRQHLEKSLGGPEAVRYELFSWSGANSQAKRNQASEALNAQLAAQRVEFQEIPVGMTFLSHSQGYQQPELLDALGAWIKGKAAARAATGA
jgi:hypothetical protein